MIRLLLGVWLGIFSSIAVVLVMYWRDDQYAPQSTELWLYFGLLPLALSVLICSPYLMWRWQKKRQAAQAEQAAIDAEYPSNPEPDQAVETTWIQLNVFSAAVQSALGENQALLQAIDQNASPELDAELLNAQGNPILSYRITDLDLALLDQLEQTEVAQDTFADVSPAYQRVQALLQQQLVQHIDTLQQIAAHLHRSALFYHTPVAQAYRLHPAWIDPEHKYEDESEDETAAQSSSYVSRLDQLNVLLILPERFLTLWDEAQSTAYLQAFLQQLGIVAEHIQCQYHYLAKASCYVRWLELLGLIEQQQHQVSLLLVLDSEIDQACIDEKSSYRSSYVASEFGSSCCLASRDVLIDALEPVRVLHMSHQQRQIAASLEQLKLSKLPQFQQQTFEQQDQSAQQQHQQQDEQAFVMVLQHSRDRQLFKKLQFQFAHTSIEVQHMRFAADSLGHSDDLAMLFGFMLALQIDPEIHSMVHSTEYLGCGVFISPAILHPSR